MIAGIEPGLSLCILEAHLSLHSLFEVPNKLGSTLSQAPAHVLPESLALVGLLKAWSLIILVLYLSII